MEYLRVKNLDQFQQYKDGRPIHWIKLHISLLDDYSFSKLNEGAQIHLLKIWLYAAKNKNRVENDAAWVARRIDAQSKVDLDTLIESGFLIPEAAPEKRKPDGVVYFIHAPESDRIKIGFSSRVDFRVQEIRRSIGENIHLIGFFPGDRSDERELHKQFDEISLGNEWFSYSNDIIDTAVRMCTEVRTNESEDAYLEERREEESREDKDTSKPAASPCPHSEIIDIYHEALPERPAILKERWKGSQSERELKARWKEDKRHQNPDFWRGYFSSVRADDWRMGRGKWKGVDLHWLVKRSNFDKVVQDWANAA